MQTNLNAPVGDHPLDALATRMLERIRNNPRIVGLWSNSDAKKLTAKDLLAAALELELRMKKGELELLQGITALAKAAVEEKASPRVPLGDTEIFVKEGEVELWEVRGTDALRNMYPTKMCAEIAARAAFPDEDADKRYGRIYFRRFVRES